MTTLRIKKSQTNGRHKFTKSVAPALLAGGLLLSATPALAAYTAGQTIYTATQTMQAGSTTMGNFKPSDTRNYDLNGQLTTNCSIATSKWGFKVDEVKNNLPDPTIASVNWGTPIKTCNAVGVRKGLSGAADGYHYVAKTTFAGSNFKASVVAR